MNVSRDSSAGRAYLDLRKLAKEQKRPTDELLDLYALEGFLARMTETRQAEKLVLKGGVLLAAFDSRRATRDVDLHAEDLNNDTETVRSVVCEIAEVAIDDGLTFDAASATAQVIRDEEEYSGVRVSMHCHLDRADVSFHVDVNVGDAIWPEPGHVEIPRLLGGVLRLRGYPIEMVLAEKIVTAIQRGTVNTRWRDFSDVYLLSRRHILEASTLAKSIATVAISRGVQLATLNDTLTGYGDMAQTKWQAWVRKQGLEERVPVEFHVVLAGIEVFADPVLRGAAEGTWNPDVGAWQ